MYKDTFKMVDGDIYINPYTGDLELTSGQEELRQNIENRLSINMSEWFLNIQLGLDYSRIQGKGVSDEEIEYAIRECVYQDDRVERLIVNNIDRRSRDRSANVNITIIDKDENELYMEEVVAGG